VEDHADLARRIAFINLKNIGGGSEPDLSEIRSATEERRVELADKIRSFKPTRIFVAGDVAHAAFRTYLARQVGVGSVYVPHPSSRFSYQEYYRRCH